MPKQDRETGDHSDTRLLFTAARDVPTRGELETASSRPYTKPWTQSLDAETQLNRSSEGERDEEAEPARHARPATRAWQTRSAANTGKHALVANLDHPAYIIFTCYHRHPFRALQPSSLS